MNCVPSGGLPNTKSVDGLSLMPASAAKLDWSISLKNFMPLAAMSFFRRSIVSAKAIGAFDAHDTVVRLRQGFGRNDERRSRHARQAQKFCSGQHGIIPPISTARDCASLFDHHAAGGSPTELQFCSRSDSERASPSPKGKPPPSKAAASSFGRDLSLSAAR